MGWTRELLDSVRRNLERLEGCAGPHTFFLTEASSHRPLRRRYRCSACGGEVGGVERHWYERGLQHGRAGA